MATILPWENEEEQNYMCMDKIVNDVLCKGLRSIFKQEWNSRYQSSFGAWDDTNASGQQLFHLENTRSRPNKSVYQAAFQHGDTSQWDCSVLFDAILYSKSIGQASLNPTIVSEVNNLRVIRNEIKHNTTGKLTNKEFQDMTTRVESAIVSLRLPVNEVNRIKVEKNRYQSFQTLPPQPVHEVVYRSEKIHQINQDLQKLRSDNDGKLTYFYISGNPGSGKSQLARQVCEDIFNSVNWQKQTTFIMTLHGRDMNSLLYSYEDLCRRLNCNESIIENIMNSSKPEEVKIKELRSQLSTRIKNWKKWWIIVDNVENLALIYPLLPHIGDGVWDNGQVIVTTQNTDCVPLDGSFTKHASLSVGMDGEECRQLLSLLSQTDNSDPLLDEVAERLDRQPLAMAAAAVYMGQVKQSNVCPQFSWKDYLEKLEKGKIKFAEKRFVQENSTYPYSMSTAAMLAIEKCAERNIIFNYVFHLFSLISFETMPLPVIAHFVQQQDENLDAEDICLVIKSCSFFLPVDKPGEQIRLHRVFHEAIKLFCNGKKSQIENASESETPTNYKESAFRKEALTQSIVRTLHCFKDRSDQALLIPHLKVFTTEIKNLFPGCNGLYSISQRFQKTDISQIYQFFAETSHRYCCFSIAIEFHEASLQIWKDFENKYFVSSIYTNIGELHRTLGNLQKAKEYHQLALQIYKEQLGPDHTNVATSYSNLGLVCKDMGNLEKAKEYHQLALEIRKEELGPDHTNVATCYNNLGSLYRNMGNLEKAREYHQLALEIWKEQLGPNHTNVATSYNNLGSVYNVMGNLEKAKEYHQLALQIYKEELGPNHTNVATSYNNLGSVYNGMGNLEKAKEYHQLALEIYKEQLGPNHTNVATSYSNLGSVYNDMGNLEKAKEYCQLALEIRKEQFAPDHTNVATCYNNLGSLHRKMGNLEKAKEYHQLALEIFKEQLGENHTNVATSYSNLGSVYNDMGNMEKAKEYCQLALEIRKEQLGPDHTNIATCYNNLGALYRNMGNLEKAKEYHQLALEIFKEQLGPNHTNVATSYRHLGSVYNDMGNLERAKEYHQLALEIRKEH